MASILLTSTIFCSRPTKLFLGAGKLCLPAPIRSSWEEPTDGVIGRLPRLSRHADGDWKQRAAYRASGEHIAGVARTGRDLALADLRWREDA